MEIIEKETRGKSYHTYKYSYDSIGLPKELNRLFRKIYEDNVNGKLNDELTPEILNTFVDTIVVHECEKKTGNGHRTLTSTILMSGL